MDTLFAGLIIAFCWGLIASSSLVVGGIIGSRLTISRIVLGIIMGFGAGVLLSAVSYELVYEAVRKARGSGVPLLGYVLGATLFYVAELLIGRSALKRKGVSTAKKEALLVVPMVLAIVLDGIPESIVIGVGLLEGQGVSLAILVAVFVSNLPEAIAGTVGMKAAGWTPYKIGLVWVCIAILCALSSSFGYLVFGNLSIYWVAFVEAFAGGAILMMLANSMIPESYEHSGRLAGVAVVIGFAMAMVMVLLEHPLVG